MDGIPEGDVVGVNFVLDLAPVDCGHMAFFFLSFSLFHLLNGADYLLEQLEIS